MEQLDTSPFARSAYRPSRVELMRFSQYLAPGHLQLVWWKFAQRVLFFRFCRI
jgi:hypothetical protein